RGRCDRAEQRVPEPGALNAVAQAVPALARLGLDAPGVVLELTPRRARISETRVTALLFREICRRAERMEVDLFGDTLRQPAGGGGVERQSQLKKDVLQPHEPQSDRAPAQIRRLCGRDWIVVEID